MRRKSLLIMSHWDCCDPRIPFMVFLSASVNPNVAVWPSFLHETEDLTGREEMAGSQEWRGDEAAQTQLEGG